MKKLLGSIITVVFFFLTPLVHAQSDAWIINNFDATIKIQQDGTVLIEEKIDTQFNAEKHGIYRDIPYEYKDQNGGKTYTKIDVRSVTQDGSPAQTKETIENGYIRIRIGNPDTTITGNHTYYLRYVATGILRSFYDHDELYWNVTGNGWDAPIQKASANVILTKGSFTDFKCFQGYTGQDSPCENAQKKNDAQVAFSSNTTLPPGSGLTIFVGFPTGTFPLLTVNPPKRIETDSLTPISLATFLLTLVIAAFTIVRLWFHQGRDFWFRAPSQLDPNAKAEIKPITAKETVVVMFEPPQNLRPAEIGVLMDEQADTLDVTATLIDLASRGYLKISEEPKKWLFGSTDYILEKTKEPDGTLETYEKMLLNRLFSGKTKTRMSELKLQFYKDLADIKTSLYAATTEKNLFAGNPEKIRQKYILYAVGTLVLSGAAIFAGFQSIFGPLATFGVAGIISGICLMITSRFMPRRTAKGRELFTQAKGYYKFISGAEKYRQQFYEKKNMFNEVLPYAIVFKLTDKFAKAMKEMGIEPTQPSWYHGTRPFNTGYFVSSVNDFSSSMSRAIAATPSSSGSGGSSGGGFGGGGGGSW